MGSVTERLVPCPEPTAPVRLFETQVPLIAGWPAIERYTTGHNAVFEKHTELNGVTQWFRVVKAQPKGSL